MWCTVNFKLLHQWIEVALAADGKGCLAYISFLDYRLFMQGQTPYAIAKYLTDKNIPTPTGKETWRHRTVKNILLSKSTKAMPACKSAIQWILRLPCGAWRNGGTVGGFQREAVPQACGLHNGLSGRQGGGFTFRNGVEVGTEIWKKTAGRFRGFSDILPAVFACFVSICSTYILLSFCKPCPGCSHR